MGLSTKLIKKQRARKIAAELADPAASPGPTHEPASTDPEQRRVDLASRWLFGYVAPEKTISIPGPDGKVDRPGLNVRKRPPQNANSSGADEPDDRECRAALAELIWEGELSPEMRWRLATLLAPTGHKLADDEEFLEVVARGPGKARGLSSSKGRLTAAGRKLQMAFFVRAALLAGHSQPDAVAAAAVRYAVSERTIEEAWARNEWAFRRFDSDGAQGEVK